MMMVIARADYLNLFEVISAYIGFSMYAGWVTTATILNISFCFKGLGYSEEKMEISESKVACYILWVAQLIYMVASYREENVVFGAVWLWAAFAILNRQREAHKDLEANLDLIIIVHGLFLFCLSMWKFYKWAKRKGVEEFERNAKRLSSAVKRSHLKRSSPTVDTEKQSDTVV